MPETSAKAKGRNPHQRMTTRQRIPRRRERVLSSLPQPVPHVGSNDGQCLATPLHHTRPTLDPAAVRSPAFCQIITAQDQLTTRRNNNALPPLLTVPTGCRSTHIIPCPGLMVCVRSPTRQGFSGARSEKRSHAAVSLDAGIF